MAKKRFSGGLNSLLGNTDPAEQKIELSQVTKTEKKEITKTSQIGTKEKETRATFIVQEELLDKMKALAYWDRVLIKDIINQAMEDYVTKHEKKNGPIQPMPIK